MKSRLSKTSHAFNTLNPLAADRPTNITNPIAVLFFFPHDDFIRKWKNFRMILEVNKLGDGQREGPRPQREECRKDGPKSKSIENLRVQNGEGKLRAC